MLSPLRLSPALIVFFLASQPAGRPDRVDEYVARQLSQRNIPGLSLAVVRDGKVIKTAGYGQASLELGAPAGADTVYEIGSITKQFTAEAVMLLLEDGKLHPDDKLTKHLVAVPAAWSGITLRHLLLFLGEERVGSDHFMLDPTVDRIRRHKVVAGAGTSYYTFHLTKDGVVRTLLVEAE